MEAEVGPQLARPIGEPCPTPPARTATHPGSGIGGRVVRTASIEFEPATLPEQAREVDALNSTPLVRYAPMPPPGSPTGSPSGTPAGIDGLGHVGCRRRTAEPSHPGPTRGGGDTQGSGARGSRGHPGFPRDLRVAPWAPYGLGSRWAGTSEARLQCHEPRMQDGRSTHEAAAPEAPTQPPMKARPNSPEVIGMGGARGPGNSLRGTLRPRWDPPPEAPSLGLPGAPLSRRGSPERLSQDLPEGRKENTDRGMHGFGLHRWAPGAGFGDRGPPRSRSWDPVESSAAARMAPRTSRARRAVSGADRAARWADSSKPRWSRTKS